jgi:5-methyltetrahydropteroyltriglutamate--homocysteine methyltransferase
VIAGVSPLAAAAGEFAQPTARSSRRLEGGSSMQRSTERILTTHTGSLARPPALLEMLLERDRGQPIDQAAFEVASAQAVGDVVARQVSVGLDIVNDGEMSKIGFANYVRERLGGLDGPGQERPVGLDARQFPGWAPRQSLTPLTAGTCTGPVAWRDFSGVDQDIAHLAAAVATVSPRPAGVFMTAVSPGTVVNFFPNHYYPDRVAYVTAVADVMQREYAAILDAGFLLQLDCPDLALHDIWFPDLTVPEFRQVVAENIRAINLALTGLATDRVRMHVCWGAGERPDYRNIALGDIVDVLLEANVGALSIVGANGHHEHEYHVWESVKLPQHMVLIPGVIDSTTNIVEHPEVVAERIQRYAAIVGKEHVIAGVDCGFGTSAATAQVDGDVAFAKLEALAEGARLASTRL